MEPSHEGPASVRSSVTISLVPEARGGPFVFWENLEHHCARARALGFDAVELFLPSGDGLSRDVIRSALETNQLKLAALGTGAGWIRQRLHLTHPDGAIRQRALEFIGGIIDLGAHFHAPAIIGSMQGRWENSVSREQALEWLIVALNELGERAGRQGVPLLYEPLNRYETNLINRIDDALTLLSSLRTRHVRLLADLFHMNIEEESIPAALLRAGSHIGHVHFVDSNRRAAGLGHLDFDAIAQALKTAGFTGYASAEALPYPYPEAAARQTIATFKSAFGK